MDIQEKSRYLEVLKQIQSDLDAATNPSLHPQQLHELRLKLQTLVNDLENELADEINNANSDAEAADSAAHAAAATPEPESEPEPESKGKLFDKPRKKK